MLPTAWWWKIAGYNLHVMSSVVHSQKRTSSSPWTPAPCPHRWSTRSAPWAPCWVCMQRSRCAARHWLRRRWSAGTGCRRTFSVADCRCCSPTTALTRRRGRHAVPAPTRLVRHGPGCGSFCVCSFCLYFRVGFCRWCCFCASSAFCWFGFCCCWMCVFLFVSWWCWYCLMIMMSNKA